MDRAFGGKVIVITGGNSGIGRELAGQLAQYSARLYLCGRNVETGEALVAKLRDRAPTTHFRAVDVQDQAAVEDFINFVLQEEGRIDYLFHCAGIILGGEIRDHRVNDIQKVLMTNVLGTAYTSYYVYRKMAEQGYGHIINIGSAAGLFPVPLMGVYSSSKFAVLGMSEALRMEGKGLGVRVSVAVPGFVDTPIYDRGTYSKTDKDTVKNMIKRKFFTISPDKAARRILTGTIRNWAVIHTQLYARLGWMSYRYFPHLFRFFMRLGLPLYRQRLRK